MLFERGRGCLPYAARQVLPCFYAGKGGGLWDGFLETGFRSAASSIPLRSMPDKAGHAVSLAGVRPMQGFRRSSALMQAWCRLLGWSFLGEPDPQCGKLDSASLHLARGRSPYASQQALPCFHASMTQAPACWDAHCSLLNRTST